MENTNENGAAVARENIEVRDIGGALQITIGGEAYRRLECVARAFNAFNAKHKCWTGEDDTPLTAFNAFCVFDGFGDFAQGGGMAARSAKWCKVLIWGSNGVRLGVGVRRKRKPTSGEGGASWSR